MGLKSFVGGIASAALAIIVAAPASAQVDPVNNVWDIQISGRESGDGGFGKIKGLGFLDADLVAADAWGGTAWVEGASASLDFDGTYDLDPDNDKKFTGTVDILGYTAVEVSGRARAGKTIQFKGKKTEGGTTLRFSIKGKPLKAASQLENPAGDYTVEAKFQGESNPFSLSMGIVTTDEAVPPVSTLPEFTVGITGELTFNGTGYINNTGHFVAITSDDLLVGGPGGNVLSFWGRYRESKSKFTWRGKEVGVEDNTLKVRLRVEDAPVAD